MKKIKNIIFDLGNVLFPISGQATFDLFTQNGVKNILDKYKILIDSGLFDNFELGTISQNEFRKGLNNIFEVNLSDEVFDNCWNAMIASYPEKNNPFLENLKTEGYNLYILSNTNKTHVEYLEPMAKWREGLFTKIYYSNEIHLRKPDRECFEFVINDAGIIADETVFIDDRAENIEGAQLCGIHAIHLLKQNELYQTLQNFLK